MGHMPASPEPPDPPEPPAPPAPAPLDPPVLPPMLSSPQAGIPPANTRTSSNPNRPPDRIMSRTPLCRAPATNRGTLLYTASLQEFVRTAMCSDTSVGAGTT